MAVGPYQHRPLCRDLTLAQPVEAAIKSVTRERIDANRRERQTPLLRDVSRCLDPALATLPSYEEEATMPCQITEHLALPHQAMRDSFPRAQTNN